MRTTHQPGKAYKRDYNKSPRGKYSVHMKRGAASRSKSRG